MGAIVGIPTTRVSDIFVRDRLLRQTQYDQSELYRVQTQLATGRRFELPSEDPVAAMRVIDLQRLLERKEQVYSNVKTNQSYLTSTDATLMNVSGLLTDARAAGLGALGTTSTDVQRQTAAQEIDGIITQLLDTGNQQFRGRYLFAGSKTTDVPFVTTDKGYVQYNGNEKVLQSYCDLDLLFQTSMTGNQVFGAISEAVKGTTDVDPVVTYDTPLSTLRGGEGISPGSIKISDGTNFSIIDLSSAETLGDLARLLTANPPKGNEVQVEITPDSLRIRLTSGDMSINEVAGGTTAHELGILAESGVGTSWVTGRDLDPVLRTTTRLDEAFGSRAHAVVRSLGKDSDLIFTADAMGTAFNNITIRFEDTAPTQGAETVSFNGTNTITIGIKAGKTQARDVIAAVTAAHTAGNIPFTVQLDPLDDVREGEGIVAVGSAVTANGAGTPLDIATGLQIVNGGETHVIDLASAETFEDVLNLINGSGAGVIAEINESGTGIDVRSRLSGCDFTVGENGGTTATQLGLRTYTGDCKLEDFNHGLGVHVVEGKTDFTITRADGVTLEINLDGAETVQDVLDSINIDNPNNADHALTARLAAYGNGIELVDESAGAGRLTVARSVLSTAAIDLGLVAEDTDQTESQVRNGTARASLSPAGANNDLIFTATNPGSYGNAAVIFSDNGDDAATFNYDSVNHRITFGMTTDASGGLPLTTAADMITMLAGHPVAHAAFTATLNTAVDPTNDGSGTIPPTTIAMTGGGPETLTSTDTNPQETKGVFSALLRLSAALKNGDVLQTQRAIDVLDAASEDLSFAHAELGNRQQALDVLQSRLGDEEITLREVLSVEYDVDLVEVASEVTARQATFEASLRATASIFQMTLLNYL